jgi:hypothetical protein
MTSIRNIPRGLPLTRSRLEQIFPKLTQAQIRRIAAHGQMRAMQRDEVLYEQGATSVPFFVVVSGELEVVRPLGTAAVKIIVRVLGSGDISKNPDAFANWIGPITGISNISPEREIFDKLMFICINSSHLYTLLFCGIIISNVFFHQSGFSLFT